MTSDNTSTSNNPPSRGRLRTWALRLLAGIAVAVGLLGVAPVAAALAAANHPTVPQHPATAAERAIVDLVGDHPAFALRDLPAGFAERVGYQPIVVDGRPMNPRGDCSSPVPLPDAFADACRAHDFGYDLLRFADSTGRPAGTWARRALDRRLIEDMHARCVVSASAGCHAAAESARVGLAVNTWRQRSGPPVRESDGTIAVTYLSRAVEALGLP